MRFFLRALTVWAVALLFPAVVLPSVCFGQNEWDEYPDPYFSPESVLFDGDAATASSTLVVADGAAITISAKSFDDDYWDIDTEDYSDNGYAPDDAQVVWVCGGNGGSVGKARTNSEEQTTWTAPTLGAQEDSRTVTLSVRADDDSTSNPGGPLYGLGGNRNDDEADEIQLTIQVTKLCTVTDVTADGGQVMLS